MAVQEKRITSEFAIASLALGICSFINLISMEKGLLAIVFGILAFRRIKREDQLQGSKLAIIGITLGIISIVLTALFTIKFWPKIRQMEQFMQQK